MKPSTRTRFPRSSVLGVLLFVAVLSACEASSCDLGAFPENPFPDLFPEIRCADDADSGPIPTETTIPPGSEPLSGDAATLAAFYNATDGLNWSDNTNWLTDASISDWSGVTASNIVNGGTVGECVVRRLYISFDRLSGEIPAELANLAHLEYLNLNGNQLSGMIPIELGKIPNLRSLDLSRNQLSGAIPAELGNLPNLEDLDLSDNQLGGEIPAELGNLPNLEDLDLSDNQLSGAIPAELGNLPNLEDLDLSDNQLGGAIPAELGNLPNLEDLDLSDNQLSGAIPAELGNLPNLEDLDLSDNQLGGEIPAELGNLPNLRLLFLQGNQLSGAIPIELGKIPNLSLDGNQLSGRIRRPNGTNPQYAWDGSTIRVSWDPVDGADYYKIYHDDFFDSSCSLRMGGSPSFCEELAANVVGTSYLHENPNASENYYWVVACNSDGCSEVESRYPAVMLEASSTGSTNTATPRPPPVPTPTPTQTPMPEVKSPANVRYALDGSTIRISWDPVDGADYYKVYYDDFSDSRCSLGRDGSPRFCEELAANVVGTSFLHENPGASENHYWVVACNTGGCSEIDSENPAAPIEPIPAGPASVTYAVEGSAIRVTWEAVPGADYYKVYYDDFSDSSCSLSRDGSPRFCEELAANVVGTSFLHENPGASENHYWVVACNRGGCSDIDSKKPAKPIETRPNGPAAAPTEKTSPLLKPTATESTPLVRDSL